MNYDIAWKVLKNELDVRLFKLQTGLFPQDMDTTIRVGSEINMLQDILKLMDEMDGTLDSGYDVTR